VGGLFSQNATSLLCVAEQLTYHSSLRTARFTAAVCISSRALVHHFTSFYRYVLPHGTSTAAYPNVSGLGHNEI